MTGVFPERQFRKPAILSHVSSFLFMLYCKYTALFSQSGSQTLHWNEQSRICDLMGGEESLLAPLAEEVERAESRQSHLETSLIHKIRLTTQSERKARQPIRGESAATCSLHLYLSHHSAAAAASPSGRVARHRHGQTPSVPSRSETRQVRLFSRGRAQRGGRDPHRRPPPPSPPPAGRGKSRRVAAGRGRPVSGPRSADSLPLWKNKVVAKSHVAANKQRVEAKARSRADIAEAKSCRENRSRTCAGRVGLPDSSRPVSLPVGPPRAPSCDSSS
ncbi:hypothetical protein AOLI_G00027850 [Acnodon oligacanthus]